MQCSGATTAATRIATTLQYSVATCTGAMPANVAFCASLNYESTQFITIAQKITSK